MRASDKLRYTALPSSAAPCDVLAIRLSRSLLGVLSSSLLFARRLGASSASLLFAKQLSHLGLFARGSISLLWALAVGTGCASTVAKILPIGEPVTLERCQKLDIKKLGFEDGVTGRRSGEKYEFWSKDCGAVGAKPDRTLYDEGYAEGLKSYCSCEIGFQAGVKDEYTEFKKQYMMCRSADYKRFLEGHKVGLTHSKDGSLVKQVAPFKLEYNEEEIQKAAVASCQKLSENSK